MQRNFSEPHVFAGAHLDNIASFPSLKMRSSVKVISFSPAVSGVAIVIQSLSFHDDLKSVIFRNQVVAKLPAILIEAWSGHTISQNWQWSSLLDFNYRFKKKGEPKEGFALLVLELQRTKKIVNNKCVCIKLPCLPWKGKRPSLALNCIPGKECHSASKICS